METNKKNRKRNLIKHAKTVTLLLLLLWLIVYIAFVFVFLIQCFCIVNEQKGLEQLFSMHCSLQCTVDYSAYKNENNN